MKIALFTETFLPSTDGIVTRLLATIDHLVDMGHELLIIAPSGGLTEYKGIPIVGVKGKPYYFYPQLQFCPPTPKIGAYLKKFQPDIVHIVNPVVLGLGGLYYAKKMKLPLVASFHTNLAAYAHTYHVPFLDPVAWNYLRTVHNLAILNLATSQAMVQEISRRGFHRVKWWEGGVNTKQFSPFYRSEDMRNLLTKGNPTRFNLLYVGRLAQEKGLDQIRHLLDAMPEISVSFVGDGPDRKRMEEVFANTNSHFVGFLHGDELASAFASADAFIFPSTTETLGLVLLEAMSSGLPIIAADSPPTRELVLKNQAGILFESKNSLSLISAVQSLVSQPDLKNQLSKRARSVALNYDWDKPTQNLLHYYKLAIRMNRMRLKKTENQSHTEKKLIHI